MYCSVYKQPLVSNADLVQNMDILFNVLEAEKVDFIVCGNMNINVLKLNHCLTDVLCVHGVKNVVSKPTCIKNRVAPTLIDLTITNVPKGLKNVEVIEAGLSYYIWCALLWCSMLKR